MTSLSGTNFNICSSIFCVRLKIYAIELGLKFSGIPLNYFESLEFLLVLNNLNKEIDKIIKIKNMSDQQVLGQPAHHI